MKRNALWIAATLPGGELRARSTGKLQRRLLKDRYWDRSGSKIVQE